MHIYSWKISFNHTCFKFKIMNREPDLRMIFVQLESIINFTNLMQPSLSKYIMRNNEKTHFMSFIQPWRQNKLIFPYNWFDLFDEFLIIRSVKLNVDYLIFFCLKKMFFEIIKLNHISLKMHFTQPSLLRCMIKVKRSHVCQNAFWLLKISKNWALSKLIYFHWKHAPNSLFNPGFWLSN